jgi:hypothetical protein
MIFTKYIWMEIDPNMSLITMGRPNDDGTQWLELTSIEIFDKLCM